MRGHKKMKINRNNYEVFLIDYLDGTLDAVLEAELLLFLEAHPDIREELEGLENVSLERQNIRFTEKSLLKKTEIKTIAGIGEENFESYFIGHYEKDLSKEQQISLDQFLKGNPQLMEEFKLHGKLLLKAESTAVFVRKEALKRKPAIGIWWISGSGLAAAIALLFALFSLLKTNEISQHPGQVAVVQLSAKPLGRIVALSTQQMALTATKKALPVYQAQTAGAPIERESFALSRLKTKTVQTVLTRDDYIAQPLTPPYPGTNVLATNSHSPTKEKKKGLLGRIIRHNLKQLATRFPKKDQRNTSDPTFVKILDGGITAFNTVTGSEVEMVKEYDKDGHLKAYQIEGEMLNVNRSMPDAGNGE